MKLFDCNLHLDQYPSPLSVINEYFHFNIRHMVTLCDNIESYNFLNQILIEKKNILIGIGLHPNRKYLIAEIKQILNIIKREVKIIGECGLDFLRMINTKKTQFTYFTKQLKIAEKHDKTVILHIVNAEKEALEILSSFKLKFVIFHWYSGSKVFINKIINNGFYFSFNKCIISFKKYQDYLKEIPIDRLLLESDAPFDYKGIITKPEDFAEIVKTIAKIKAINTKQCLRILYNNFKSIFLNNNNYRKKAKNLTLNDFL